VQCLGGGGGTVVVVVVAAAGVRVVVVGVGVAVAVEIVVVVVVVLVKSLFAVDIVAYIIEKGKQTSTRLPSNIYIDVLQGTTPTLTNPTTTPTTTSDAALAAIAAACPNMKTFTATSDLDTLDSSTSTKVFAHNIIEGCTIREVSLCVSFSSRTYF